MAACAGGDLALQHAHRGAGRPVDGKDLGEQRVARRRRAEPLLVEGMGKGFGAGEQRRAEHDAVGAERQGSDEIAARREPAGGKDRHVDRIGNRRQQAAQLFAPPDMAARLDALRDDHFGAGRHRGASVGDGADLVHDADAGLAEAGDGARVDVPEQGDEGHVQLDDGVDLARQQGGRRRGRYDVDAEPADARLA